MPLIVISGSRNWSGEDLYLKIRSLLLQMPPETTLIHGGCRGVDMTADRAAREIGMPVKVFPAEWERYGLKAGPIRNAQMLDQNPDIVYVFHPNLGESKGTLDMIKQAKSRGIPVYHCS